MFQKTFLPLLLAAAVLPFTPAAQAGSPVPSFSAAFSPDTIGPGGTSTLTFTIDNSGSPFPVTGLAFTANLPAGVTIATPSSAKTDCTGPDLVLSAPDGGGTISLSDATIGAGKICTVMVNVIGTADDNSDTTHMLMSGDLTSSAGNSGPASADLFVMVDRPGFSKNFTAESPINVGDKTTLVFTIDNSLNGNQANSMTFTDNLPTGLVVAGPPNVVNTCTDGPFTGGIVTATPGSSTISLSNGGGTNVAAVAAGQICTISVDVVATGAGRLENVTGELSSLVSLNTRSGGKAGAVLDVNTPGDLLFTKSFIDDPATPGSTVILEFTISNRSRTDAATGITFTDDLSTVLTGLTATLPPDPDPPCGAGSTLTGSAGNTVLTLTGGSLAPEETCTFRVTLDVPAGATAGSYVNTTGDLTATVGGDGIVVPGASDTLFINNAPLITKEFTDDPVVAGGSTRMEFTITNTSSTSAATDITFIDDLTAWLPFPVSVTLPPTPDPPCGPGSSLSLISLDTGRQGLQLTGGTLAEAGMAGDSCTFEVIVDIPLGVSTGIYTNTTDPISATVDGGPVTGKTATDTLEVVGGVTIRKEFINDPVPPGGTATLEFTLSLDDQAPADATNIAFTDDLGTTLAGLVSSSGTLTNICGTGSQITGTSTLDFTGGTLSPGESCTFSVQVDVPAGAVPGTYSNNTSNVTATIDALATQGQPAEDDILVTGLTFSKEFLTNPVIPGGTTTLRFTLDNSSGAQAADINFFFDDLDEELPGLAATGPPTLDTCGGDMSGTDFLIYTGGSVPAGQICVIEVPVLVPAGAVNDTYRNQTSNLSVDIGGNTVSLPPAIDELTVTDTLLVLTKEFIDDPIEPGGTGTLEFTLTNLDATNAATGITFTDDLDAALSGLVSTSGTVTNPCGLGSEISGTGMLTFTGGSLAAGDSCTFSVQVMVPSVATAGSYPNTTSSVTGTIGGLGVTGEPASDDLEVGQITFTKLFVPDKVLPGGIATLQFTITNNSADSVANIGFTDDLDALIPGAVAVGTPIADVCGAGSQLAGTSLLTLTGGELLPAGSCTFSVDVLIPPDAPLGVSTNTTSDLFVFGVSVAPPAMADLFVDGAGDNENDALSVVLDANGAAWVDGVLRPGDIDFYRIVVPKGSEATVYTSGALDTRGDLFDSSGNLLNDPILDGDAGGGGNFRSTVNLIPGTYFVRVIGVSPGDDGPYMFHTELVTLNLQPDMKIGKRLSGLIGDNIYNGNSAGQKIVVRGRAKRGRKHKYFLACQNDGEFVDTITMGRIGKRYNSRKWKARIFQLTGGRRNVTGAFERRDVRQTLAPAEQVNFKVIISLKSNSSRRIRRGFGERAISGFDPAKFDTTRSRFILRP